MSRLPAGLVAHTVRVRTLARSLAKLHGIDIEACDLGAACHDLARHMAPDALLEEAENLEIDIDPVERRVPIMLHGPVVAAWLERDREILDSRVIEAVRHHTTGSPGIGCVTKVVFLADKLEPNKVQRGAGLGEVLHLAKMSIDLALLEHLNRGMMQRIERGDLVHPSTLALRNELAMSLPQNELVSGEQSPSDKGVG
jgi:predicted HD superfamily hydrolase involved in NAD metabolism